MNIVEACARSAHEAVRAVDAATGRIEVPSWDGLDASARADRVALADKALRSPRAARETIEAFDALPADEQIRLEVFIDVARRIARAIAQDIGVLLDEDDAARLDADPSDSKVIMTSMPRKTAGG